MTNEKIKKHVRAALQTATAQIMVGVPDEDRLQVSLEIMVAITEFKADGLRAIKDDRKAIDAYKAKAARDLMGVFGGKS